MADWQKKWMKYNAGVSVTPGSVLYLTLSQRVRTAARIGITCGDVDRRMVVTGASGRLAVTVGKRRGGVRFLDFNVGPAQVLLGLLHQFGQLLGLVERHVAAIHLGAVDQHA